MARNWDIFFKNKKAVGTGLALACFSSQIFASGFQLLEQNVTNLGLAYSGTAALAEDASTNYYNVAGLTRLGESELVLSALGVRGDFDFTATHSNVSLLPNTSVAGSAEDSPGTSAVIPAFHLSKRLDDKWVLGFSVATPFGLDTEYDKHGIARYIATNTHLQTFNLSPSVAYQMHRCLSVGVGADALYADADLEVRVGLGDTATDGFQKNHADGWGYGWHAGLLWTPWNGATRLGLHYRSGIELHTKGNSENLNPITVNYTLVTVRTNVSLPDTATFSFYQALGKSFALTGDVAWTHWDRFKTLDLRFTPSGPTTDSDTPEYYQDAWRYALGLIYTHSQHWLFRIGAAFDETPVTDEFRTARVPDQDRIWAAIGGAYTFNERLRLDFGYAHLFFKDATLNEVAPLNAVTRSPVTLAALAGNYDSSADIVGIQIRYNFV